MIDFEDQLWLDEGFKNNAVDASEECQAAIVAFFSREDGVARSSPSIHQRDAGIVVVYDRWNYMGVYMSSRVAVFDNEDGTLQSDGPLDANERWVFIHITTDMSLPTIIHFDSKNEAIKHIESFDMRPDTIKEMVARLGQHGEYHRPSTDYYYLRRVDDR